MAAKSSLARGRFMPSVVSARGGSIRSWLVQAPSTRRKQRDQWGTPVNDGYSAVHGWATRPTTGARLPEVTIQIAPEYPIQARPFDLAILGAAEIGYSHSVPLPELKSDGSSRR